MLFEEHSSSTIEKLIKGKKLCTSTFMFLEAERNVIHHARRNKISAEIFEQAMQRIQDDTAGFHIKDVSLDLLFTRTFPAVTTPQSADLIHLRTALWFLNNLSLSLFLTTDAAQQRAARELGLPVRHA